MTIIVTCRCNQQFRAEDSDAGMQAQCPQCHQLLVIPGPRSDQKDSSAASSGHTAGPKLRSQRPILIQYLPLLVSLVMAVAVVGGLAYLHSQRGQARKHDSQKETAAQAELDTSQRLSLSDPEQTVPGTPEQNRGEDGSAARDSLSTADLGATLRYTSALFKEWQDELGRARGQTQGNNIAAEKEISRVNEQNVRKITEELSKLEGQSVQWRFTITQILEDFINFREAPNTGYAWPNDQSNPMFIWFSDGSSEQFAHAPGYLKIKGNISRSDAEKLRPGDSLLIRGRLTVRVVPEIGNALRIAIQLNNVQVLVLGNKTVDSPEVKQMLAQREKEKEARLAEDADVCRKTLLSAAPGTRYLGSISHNTEKTVQQILLVFTEQTNSSLRFQITNPDKPKRRQTFSGQVVSNLGPLDDGSRPFIIQTKAVSTSFGYDSHDQKNWWSWQSDRLFALFFCDDKATINLRVTDDGMEGLAGYVGFGNVFTIRLKRLQGSAHVSGAQSPRTEKIAETQPESGFLGEWINKDFQTLGITRIRIKRANPGSSRIVVHLWSKSSQPTGEGEMDHGDANATLDKGVLSVNQTSLIDVDRMEMTLLENGDMQVDAHPRFTGRESVDHTSGKSVFGARERLQAVAGKGDSPQIGNGQSIGKSDGKAAEPGPLSGTWQASTGASFRIDDDGTTITITLDTSDFLREFSGTLTRRDNAPDSKSLSGTVDAVFRPDSPKRYTIHVTGTLDDPNHLALRFTDWPAWNNAGRSIGKKIFKETLTRSNGETTQSRPSRKMSSPR